MRKKDFFEKWFWPTMKGSHQNGSQAKDKRVLAGMKLTKLKGIFSVVHWEAWKMRDYFGTFATRSIHIKINRKKLVLANYWNYLKKSAQLKRKLFEKLWLNILYRLFQNSKFLTLWQSIYFQFKHQTNKKLFLKVY